MCPDFLDALCTILAVNFWNSGSRIQNKQFSDFWNLTWYGSVIVTILVMYRTFDFIRISLKLHCEALVIVWYPDFFIKTILSTLRIHDHDMTHFGSWSHRPANDPMTGPGLTELFQEQLDPNTLGDESTDRGNSNLHPVISCKGEGNCFRHIWHNSALCWSFLVLLFEILNDQDRWCLIVLWFLSFEFS